jgi:ankyrin repeat protein
VGPRSAAGSDYKGDEGEYPYEQEQDVQGYGEMSEQDVTDIFSFARHGRCEEIERLFNRGLPADVRDEFGNTLLIIACQNGNKRVAKLVLRRGANINARNYKGNTPLHYCFHCE